METAINAEGLTKDYGSLRAVDSLSIEVRAGEIFGLLGPNGAGKTTTFKMLATLLKPTGGEGRILGFDIRRQYREIRRRIGYMPQFPSLYEDLSIRENLMFFGKAQFLRGRALVNRVNETLFFVDLLDRAHHLTGRISGGMKQRVSLACALIHQPGVLFLDEPTAGVDPKLRQTFWKGFNQLREAGVTILISTHQMDEAEYCDRLAFLHQGRMVVCDTPRNILDMGESVISAETTAGPVVRRTRNYRRELPALIERLLKGNKKVTSVDIERHNLETVFLRLIEEDEITLPKEKRHFVRVQESLPVRLRLARGSTGFKVYHGTTHDISAGGARVSVAADFFLEEALEKMDEYSSEIVIIMPEGESEFQSRCRLVWKEREKGVKEALLGIEFVEPDQEVGVILNRYVKEQYLRSYQESAEKKNF